MGEDRAFHLRATSHRGGVGLDAASLFALFAVAPFLLPALGVQLGDVAFAVPLGLLTFAAARCAAAARRPGTDRRLWIWLAVAAGLGAAASALAVISGILGISRDVAFYFGALASVVVLLTFARLADLRLRGHGHRERALEGLLLGLVVYAAGLYLVVVPGFTHGDVVLTAVFAVDLMALVLIGVVAMVERRRGPLQTAWCLAAGWSAATVGDALVAATAAGDISVTQSVTAALWAVTGFGIALATDWAGETRPERSRKREISAVTPRVLAPMAAVLAFPVGVTLIWVLGDLQEWTVVLFGVLFVIALVAASLRQAYLLLDQRRAAERERELREDVERHNAELEALTGLATTMIETLEEAPIVEQGLGVVQLAAQASSAALHLEIDGKLRLSAIAGAWDDDREWVREWGHLDRVWNLEQRGGRQIARLPMHPRGERLGVVTLVRRTEEPFDEAQQNLLRLLVDELAVAVQHARTYRERLEQAIRDPLTGLYNRRFFYEAFEKEMRRSERYGSAASLVLFDVDDFKVVNDTLGHAAGDEVLREIARIASDLIRPADSLARVGGEELALLLPETTQLDALLVGERIRTAIARSPLLEGRRITVSGGVSTCPQDATTVDALEKKADDALYWAKRNGKNLCAVASEVSIDEDEATADSTLAHLYALVAATDAQQLQTRDHSENVALYAISIAQAMGLDRDHVVRLRRAALLHDLGKIAVRSDILHKPGPLTPEEFAEIRTHPVVGAAMARHAGLEEESEWIRHHHERIDGAGYPDGLAGHEIPFEARIIFVADAFEAMTSDRPYRRGMDVPEAIEELRSCAGTQFDPVVVDALVGLVEEQRLTVLSLRG
jgi:diguanylate cyclase (GGDEF)-like protein/putative nucleotidyltransferase with HDIG domain